MLEQFLKTDEESSEDDEEFGNTKQALEVEFSDNFNPESVPQNGHEYLQQVIYERSRCKKLVKADIDTTKFLHNKTVCVRMNETCKASPVACTPTKEWQCRAVRDFRYFRNVIESHIHREPTSASFNEEKFVQNISIAPPKFSQIIKYSQSSKIRMLQLIIKHLDELDEVDSWNESLGTWIFALLVLIEIPLIPSDCHVLRELARKCSELRVKLPDNSDKSLYNPLNFYITIVSDYFCQFDLAN